MGSFLEMAGNNTTLILCTALSQQPCLIYESQGGKSAYRPRDFQKLLAFAGVTAPCTVAPVMAEQFRLDFKDEKNAGEAEQRLRALQVAGRPAIGVERKGNLLFNGCVLRGEPPRDSVLRIAGSDRCTDFYEIFYQVGGIKSGMHHPDGLLWIRTPARTHFVHKEKIPLTSVAPTLLDMFSVPRGHFIPSDSLKGYAT